jgi:hypothetical protein
MPKFNQAFWNWFSDSKVVDAHGQPLVVWHGSPKKFSAFTPRSSVRVDGHSKRVVKSAAFFFSESFMLASAFGEDRKRITREQFWIQGCYLRVLHPLNLLDVKELDKLQKRCGVRGTSYETYTAWHIFDDSENVDKIIRAGYDGAILSDVQAGFEFGLAMSEASKPTWAVFLPTQIKHAFSNDGTWDADDPDIRSNPGVREDDPDGYDLGLSNGQLVLDMDDASYAALTQADFRRLYWAAQQNAWETAAESLFKFEPRAVSQGVQDAFLAHGIDWEPLER